MFLKRTGLKYKFIGLSIAVIVISAIAGSLMLQLLIHLNRGYSVYLVGVVALFFVIVGIFAVIVVSRLMVQPVVSLTKKVHEVQQGNLDTQFNDDPSGRRLDEIDLLFDGFQQMVQHLRENIDALTRSKEQAEQVSQELSESKKKLEAIFNGISDGIMIIDREFRIVSTNPVMQKIMGRELAEIEGQHCYEMCNGTQNRCSFCKADMAFKSGQHMTSYCTKTLDFLGGEEKIFEIHDFPLYNENGEIDQIIEYAKDVTEALKMQANLESSKRLAAIGEMAAKVAHEVRNPLNAIKGAAHYLRTEFSSADSESYLSLIEQQVERVNQVATDLLDLSKPLEAVFHPGDLENVVNRSLMIAEHQLRGRQIGVTREIAPRLPKIPLDEAQMEQALLNLILNSVDAMESGGHLRITLKMAPNGKLKTDGMLQLVVSDNGCGIMCKDSEDLFKPFYTTKTKGTGLGLTIVKKIIDNHHGGIEIKSQKGKGTDVILTFPVELKKYEAQEDHISH
ncbi:MAG: PAS domain-containing sensor histidine kinase [bacterium]